MRAIVTGAARGIGRAICRRLCADAAARGGAQLVLADQHEAELHTLADELRAQGLSVDEAISELLRRRGHTV